VGTVAAVAAALGPGTAVASVEPPARETMTQPAPGEAESPAETRSPPLDELSAAQPSARSGRDPFRPFHFDLRPRVEARRTPLEQVNLGSLTLVAIVFDTEDPKAMVEDATGLGHTIGIGTKIGDQGGVVKAIEPDRVIVEQKLLDFYGDEKAVEVVLELEPKALTAM
jgi:type IV pilus assembly protein PilP